MGGLWYSLTQDRARINDGSERGQHWDAENQQTLDVQSSKNRSQSHLELNWKWWGLQPAMSPQKMPPAFKCGLSSKPSLPNHLTTNPERAGQASGFGRQVLSLIQPSPLSCLFPWAFPCRTSSDCSRWVTEQCQVSGLAHFTAGEICFAVLLLQNVLSAASLEALW